MDERRCFKRSSWPKDSSLMYLFISRWGVPFKWSTTPIENIKFFRKKGNEKALRSVFLRLRSILFIFKVDIFNVFRSEGESKVLKCQLQLLMNNVPIYMYFWALPKVRLHPHHNWLESSLWSTSTSSPASLSWSSSPKLTVLLIEWSAHFSSTLSIVNHQRSFKNLFFISLLDRSWNICS